MYPRLDDIVKADDVQKKGGGRFEADYVNWARIAHYLREHAPGWQPFAAPAPDGSGFVWHAPDGTCFLMIGFRHPDPEMPDTETVPHAIMDNSMKAKKNPDARDVSDAFVRGMCKAAALLFGLGWKLWSKDDPMARDEKPAEKPKAEKRGPRFSASELGEAMGAIAVSGTLQMLKNVWSRVLATEGWMPEELQALTDAKDKRKAELEDGDA